MGESSGHFPRPVGISRCFPGSPVLPHISQEYPLYFYRYQPREHSRHDLNDMSRPPPHIYTSDVPSPPLPRQSIIHHLFPELDNPSSPPFPPSTPTLIDAASGKTLTRAEVLLQTQRLAGGLRKLGLKRGDVVGVIGVNSLEWCNAVYGSLAAGLRVSPMNYA